MVLEKQQLIQLAENVFGAIEHGDSDAFLACFEAGGVVIRNDGEGRSAESVSQQIGRQSGVSTRHSYSAVRREIFEGGFVEEHAIRSSRPDGKVTTRRACVIGRIGQAGLLHELHEYIGP